MNTINNWYLTVLIMQLLGILTSSIYIKKGLGRKLKKTDLSHESTFSHKKKLHVDPVSVMSNGLIVGSSNVTSYLNRIDFFIIK
jgi:hypothetical protein